MVMRIEQVEKQIEEGRFNDAYGAIDEILSLGPQNTGALKLKALMFAYEGRFVEEARVWKKVLGLDPEDEEALSYFERTLVEQKEHEYFSDFLPSGGIRFLASPRNLVNSTFVGLIGCAVFLMLMNFSHRFLFLAKVEVAYVSFFLCVVAPWIFILVSYVRSLRDITIDHDSIHLRTRTADLNLAWRDIAHFSLVRGKDKKTNTLHILLLSKDESLPPVLINIGLDSVIRAPSYLIREISRVFHEPSYEVLDGVQLFRKPILFR